ncbi:MAG TPA: hypothetical protein VF290_16010 [Pyrinomonadaceae bacterium]
MIEQITIFALLEFAMTSPSLRSREYLLTTRLVHDLGVAAAALGYDLLVYLPTVDSDGFDVIFRDRDRVVAMQLKLVVAEGKAVCRHLCFPAVIYLFLLVPFASSSVAKTPR